MISRLAINFVLALLGTAAFAAEPEVDSKQLPRVPATEATNALATFRVKPGFRLELAADEPLVVSPVAMSFDEDGRLYVVEMRDYSERRPERLGRVRLLEDTDGDGRFDKSTVFAEGLPWPTAVICWAGGVFVGATPDILYFKDTDGDGKADVRETIFTGFASDYAPFATNKLNVQALMNSFNWSLDNRIHGATSFSGGKVKLVDSPFVRAWIDRAGTNLQSAIRNPQSLDLRGRDFSFDPRTLEMRTESGGGQHGMSFDNRGRKFVCSNSDHIQLIMYEDRYAARNPYFNMPSPRVSIAVDGPAAEVFRISPDEPWRVIRTQWRMAGQVPGPVEGGGRASGYFTGATGVTIYRGDAYGEDFVGDAFIGDAGGNLVHRKKLIPDAVASTDARKSVLSVKPKVLSDPVTWTLPSRPGGFGLRAERPADEQKVEFLASTDNWFRPVQFANAPDGCLYIADMYREVIEHPWSLPESLKKHLDLNSGNDRGRIYRIVPEKFKPRRLQRLNKADASDLVKLIDHPNGWHRDTAARLLYERQDREIVPALTRVTRKSHRPDSRFRACYILQGLNALTPELLASALADKDATVREHAVRLAEAFLSRSNTPPSLAAKVATLASDGDSSVLFPLAFTVGDFAPALRVRASETILTNQATVNRVRSALLNSLGDAAPELFNRVARQNFRADWEFKPGLAEMIGVRNRPTEVATVLKSVPDPRESWLAISMIAALADGLSRAGTSLSQAAPTSTLAPFFTAAREWSTNTVRIRSQMLVPGGLPRDAVRLLGCAPYADAAPTLLAMLDPTQMYYDKSSTMASALAAEGETAALAALGNYPGAQVAADLLTLWPKFGSRGRERILDLLLKRTERVRVLLVAMEARTVSPAELTTAQQVLLRSHRDTAIREQAARLLGPPPETTRQAVVESYLAALALKGIPVNGRSVFLSRCASCHWLAGVGVTIGPKLTTVRDGGKEKLLTSILDPNREVAPNFASFEIETKEGDSLTGIIGSESATSVAMLQASGGQIVVARSNIVSMRSLGKSLMPEGLEAGLSQQDMADLLEFIVAP